MFSVGFWQLFQQMANCSASQAADLFGGPAILGPSGGRPWLLGGSEDPWLSVPVFRRVWLYQSSLSLRFLCRSRHFTRREAARNRAKINESERPVWVVVSTDRRNTIILTEVDGVLFNEKKVQARGL